MFSSRAVATTSDRASATSDWRLIIGDGAAGWAPATGARNMALDHTLLNSAQAHGSATLRLYRWNPACLSFGRNQHAHGVYDPAKLAAAGIDCARRPTGGLAVLHHLELTYCVAAPIQRVGGPRAAYHAINRALVCALQRLGVPAIMAEHGPRRGPVTASAEPCFQAPAAGEVVARGRKLIGSAQRAERGALLQHGSILLDGTQTIVPSLLVRGSSAPAAGDGAITLRELTGGVPEWNELAAAIVAGFEAVFGTRLATSPLSEDEAERAHQLEQTYRSDTWIWRR